MSYRWDWDGTANDWATNHWKRATPSSAESAGAIPGASDYPVYPGDDRGSSLDWSEDAIYIETATPPNDTFVDEITFGYWTCSGSDYGQGNEENGLAFIAIKHTLTLGSAGGGDGDYPSYSGSSPDLETATIQGHAWVEQTSNELFADNTSGVITFRDNSGSAGCVIHGIVHLYNTIDPASVHPSQLSGRVAASLRNEVHCHAAQAYLHDVDGLGQLLTATIYLYGTASVSYNSVDGTPTIIGEAGRTVSCISSTASPNGIGTLKVYRAMPSTWYAQKAGNTSSNAAAQVWNAAANGSGAWGALASGDTADANGQAITVDTCPAVLVLKDTAVAPGSFVLSATSFSGCTSILLNGGVFTGNAVFMSIMQINGGDFTGCTTLKVLTTPAAFEDSEAAITFAGKTLQCYASVDLSFAGGGFGFIEPAYELCAAGITIITAGAALTASIPAQADLLTENIKSGKTILGVGGSLVAGGGGGAVLAGV